jgi:hypothetical protein
MYSTITKALYTLLLYAEKYGEENGNYRISM